MFSAAGDLVRRSLGAPLSLRRRLTTASTRVDRWLSEFSHGLATGHVDGAFSREKQCFWRDMVAFTWSIRTCEGVADISAALKATAPAAAPHEWRVHGVPADGPDGETEAWLRFRTAAGSGRAHVRLDAAGKASTLLTVLSELDARPFATGRHRPLGHPCETVDEIATPRPGKRYWHEKRAAELPAALGGEAADEPHVLIIGGGQFGLSLGARLSLLGVPYVIAEASGRVGDSWRARYPGLLLHDPVWYDHLPYMPFPPSWPVFTPRDKLADWLEGYARAMDINVATETAVTSAAPPGSEEGGDERWTVQLQRRGRSATLRPAHVVFATGMSGYPRVPEVAGSDAFAGTAMHSSKYGGAGGGRFEGRRAVVVGSNTSAHDICQDLWEQGAASVTMLQRSAGLVVSEESVLSHGLGALYSEDAVARGVTHEAADLQVTTLPYRLQEPRWQQGTAKMRATDAKLHAGLQAVGYNLDFEADGTGVFGKSLRQGGAPRRSLQFRAACRMPHAPAPPVRPRSAVR